METILHPGDFVFTRAPARLRTVLGSCVALTVWHPRFYLGGMCHFLLPHREESQRENDERYGDVALHQMWLKMSAYAELCEYELCLFGGAQILSHPNEVSVGTENLALAHEWLDRNALTLKYEKTGGSFSRTVILDLSDGSVMLKETA